MIVPSSTHKTEALLEIVQASVVGNAHRHRERNNQDAVAIHRVGDTVYAAVCDGCGSGAHSEFGAQFIARWLVTHASRFVANDPISALAAMADALTTELNTLAASLAPAPSLWLEVITECLLATFLLLVWGPERVWIGGIGDGVWGINGELHTIDSGQLNAPPYLAYRLVPVEWMASPVDHAPRLWCCRATSDVRTAVIGSDGFGTWETITRTQPGLSATLPGLSRLMSERCFWRNPSWLQKQLRVFSSKTGQLQDDSSAVVIRRGER